MACMKTVNDLNIPSLVPLEGDISVEVLAEQAGIETDFLGEPSALNLKKYAHL
jgi:hypothetical protein